MASWLGDREGFEGGGTVLDLERRVELSQKQVKGEGVQAEGRHGGEKALSLFLEL